MRDEKRQKKQARDQELAAERAAKPPKRSRHWLDFENRAAQPPALPTVVANNSFAAVTSGPNCRDVLRGYLKPQEIPAENTDSLKRFIGTFHDHMKVQARASNRKVGEEVLREIKRLVSRTMPPSKVTFVEAACGFDLQKNGPLGDAGTWWAWWMLCGVVVWFSRGAREVRGSNPSVVMFRSWWILIFHVFSVLFP